MCSDPRLLTVGHTAQMNILRLILCLSWLLIAGPAFAGASRCDLHEFTSSRELHRFLSLRAVDIVRQAENSGGGLAALVDPTAMFNLGAGDVGRPLGTGIDGARALARTMQADLYRFLGWDSMDMEPNACSEREVEVEVEFIDSQGKRVSSVKFTFEVERVRLVSAVGWEKSFEAGQL
ncbi:hypothetical protein DYQ91_01540 [Xanthomonas sp. LMG 8989]|nr:hypothetical protein [Xanthomonas sp. LMG 8989]